MTLWKVQRAESETLFTSHASKTKFWISGRTVRDEKRSGVSHEPDRVSVQHPYVSKKTEAREEGAATVCNSGRTRRFSRRA